MKDISPYLNRIDFLNDAARQIEKDFGWKQMQISFSGKPETAYEELALQIRPYIEKFISGKHQKILQPAVPC